MKNIIIKQNTIPNIKDAIELYENVNWSLYTNNPENLQKALENSLYVWSAYDKDKLVGLARVVGDNHSIIYIQDILVLNNYQNKGIGTKLLGLILDKYINVRQIVLMTDSNTKNINFYQKNGLKNSKNYKLTTFIK